MQHGTIDSRPHRESAEDTSHPSGAMASTADRPDEPAAPSSRTGETEAQSAGSDQVTPVEAGTVPTFLHEIARQMVAAAGAQRARISADVANSLEEHVRQVRIRSSKEAEELRRLAETDVDQINEWSAAEAERLRHETETRIAARREHLERHLRQHDDLIEREISGASESVEEYQAELDRFVERLAAEQDPTDIARLASQVPEPPRVDEIASAARAEAIAEVARSEAADDAVSAKVGLVGVMDTSVVKQATGHEDASKVESIGDDPTADLIGGRNRAAVLVTRVVLFVLVVVLIAGALLLATGRVTVTT
jgi:hypothetical protein